MAEIINLRRARKARARSEAEVKAAANRASHGRSRQEKTASHAEADREQRVLDGHKLDGE